MPTHSSGRVPEVELYYDEAYPEDFELDFRHKEHFVESVFSADEKIARLSHGWLQKMTFFRLVGHIVSLGKQTERELAAKMTKKSQTGKMVVDTSCITHVLGRLGPETTVPYGRLLVKNMMNTWKIVFEVYATLLDAHENNNRRQRQLDSYNDLQEFADMIPELRELDGKTNPGESEVWDEFLAERATIAARLSKKSSFSKLGGALDENLALSTLLLCEYVVAVLDLICPVESSALQLSTLTGAADTFIGGIIERRMLDAGWCIAEISMLPSGESLLGQWYHSLLEAPGPHRNHSTCELWKSCLGYQTNEDEYQTQHVEHGCDCKLVFANQDSLAKILLGSPDAVPLVSTTEPKRNQSDDRLYVDLVSSNSGEIGTASGRPSRKKWTAISHVWSDGMGNPRGNAITLCQFRRVRRLLSDIHVHYPHHQDPGSDDIFWLDTLCFPLQPQEAYDTALIRMRESYESANVTLVLDSYISSFDASVRTKATVLECVVHIVSSPWNRRLWTFQEAFLTKEGGLMWQFADRAISEYDLFQIEDKTNDDKSHHHQVVINCLMGFIKKLAQLRRHVLDLGDKNRSKQDRLQDVAHESLPFRSTSVAADEGLCLGNLVDIDATLLVKARNGHQRMAVIWTEMMRDLDTANASPIFWAGPKLPLAGYRWAPATLMHKQGVTDVESGDVWDRFKGCVRGLSRLGLRVCLPALVFDSPCVLADLTEGLRIDVKVGSSTHVFASMASWEFLESSAALSERPDLSQSELELVVLLSNSSMFIDVAQNKPASPMDSHVRIAVRMLKSGDPDCLHLLLTGLLIITPRAVVAAEKQGRAVAIDTQRGIEDNQQTFGERFQQLKQLQGSESGNSSHKSEECIEAEYAAMDEVSKMNSKESWVFSKTYAAPYADMSATFISNHTWYVD